ncbi:MAG: pyridoxal phosphate-dependent aminotransferase [Dehalococcoidia bacterium]|nr:pyridoxal phosphate-dependent aminotransferase [Dehalococcoidia bacterium]RIL02218.1 MAG: putative C-S lyase [bacterium]
MSYDFDTVYDRTNSESAKWHHHPPGVLPMFVADMDFRSPEPVIRALHERVEHGFFGYGTEQPEFYEVICARLARRYGWPVQPEAIVLLPGVIPSFNLAVREFAAPGDGVLMHAPTYEPILRCPGNYGMDRHEALLVRGPAGGYIHDPAVLEAAVTERTRVFVLCNPHNPTGHVFTRAELAHMAEVCLDRNILIVSDEIHCDLVYPGHEHVPIATLSPEVEARTITLMAPSKTFNLPGLKASIAVIPNEELRARFVAARGDLVKAVNILGYTAALSAYRDCDEWLAELMRYLEANRDFLLRYVATELPGISVSPPEGTYLAWLDCRAMPAAQGDPHRFFLERAKVGLSDGVSFGEQGHGFVRLNFACPRSLLEEGLDRMARAVRHS